MERLVTPNDFSATWYDIFLDPIPSRDTTAETAFVLRHLPPDRFPSLLDVCCGPGRHAMHLARHGYEILGIDKSRWAIDRAQRIVAPRARFLVHDMRDIEAIPATFDGVLNLWHSFGYFDDATNYDILRQINSRLRPGGRFVLDIYNRDSLVRLPLRREIVKEGVRVVTEYIWSGNRVTCKLTYDGDREGDTFEWRIYSPAEICEQTRQLRLRLLTACAWFDEELQPGPEHTRMQFVFERASSN